MGKKKDKNKNKKKNNVIKGNFKKQELNKYDTGFKISAVLVVRNEQSNVAESIRSLLNQSYPCELIVIDDGSTDETPNIIETFREKIEDTGGKIKLYKTHKGAAVRRNIGNKLATGDVIMVCDADLYPRERSEAVKEVFEQNVDVMYSAYSVRLADSLFISSTYHVVEWDFNSKCTVSHPTVAYKRSDILEFPYLEVSKETDMFEDVLFRMHDANKIFAIVKNPLMQKIEGNSNRDKTKAKKLKQKMYDDRNILVKL